MVFNISESMGNVMLNSLSDMLNGGYLELLTSGGEVVVVLTLPNPVAQEAAGGELKFNPIPEATAEMAGQVQFARALAPSGDEVFACDISDEGGDGVIRLSTTQLGVGSPVKLNSFKLRTPS
jgi:hypothetical protein